MPGTPCIGPTCSTDYPNGQAPKACLLEWRGQWFSPSFFVRIVPATLEVESAGGYVTHTQAYRFLGVEADRIIGRRPAAANLSNAGETSDGTANQWYQKGRQDSGYTPSAATPGTSNHGEYLVGATDCDTSHPAIRSDVFPKYGLDDPIGSEPWHWQASIAPTIPIPTLQEAIIMAALSCDPEPGRRNSDNRPVWLLRPPTAGYRSW